MKMQAILIMFMVAVPLAALSAAAGGAGAERGDRPLEEAIFAGGCFWCMEPPFDEVDGVVSTTSGYTGGHKENPTYEEVSSGRTGHAEAIRIVYDPSKVDYRKLLEIFWRNVDPADAGGQFCDRGSQYRSAVFYRNEEQKRLAAESKTALEASGRFDGGIATEIAPAGPLYVAEEYHQDYYRKNPIRYNFYRYGCGRDKRLSELWGKG
jgi:peptide-methionine (S)-S-oxide reductase